MGHDSCRPIWGLQIAIAGKVEVTLLIFENNFNVKSWLLFESEKPKPQYRCR